MQDFDFINFELKLADICSQDSGDLCWAPLSLASTIFLYDFVFPFLTDYYQ